MAIISLIAAIDEVGGLGINNQLLCHLPADLQHFKNITMGKPIIMGRNTFSSIGKPLPGRTNIVLSRSLLSIKGVVVFNAILKAIDKYKEADEIMIIGGAEIFKQSIEMATRMYITRIHHRFAADAFFPNIDESLWHCQNKEFLNEDNKNQYAISFCTYERS
jgi:dihydrofolate reductase